MVKKLDAIKIYEIAESGNTGASRSRFQSIHRPQGSGLDLGQVIRIASNFLGHALCRACRTHF